MAEKDHQMLADLPSWQTAVMMLRWANLKELQTFVTGNTFSPHWQEFEAHWLASGHEGAGKAPSHLEIVKQCLKSWHSGRNDYYLMQPETSAWNDHLGLGHYIRLLTMIVRENTATNGVWKSIKRESDLERCFQEAFMIVNCMREEWARKGKLYNHFKATNQRSPAHFQLRQDAKIALPNPFSAMNQTSVPKKGAAERGSENGKFAMSSDRTPMLLQDDREEPRATSLRDPQKGTATTQARPINSRSPVTVKKETLSEVGNNFLECLDAELDKKRTEIQRTVYENGVQPPSNGSPINKRPATSDSTGSNKRRKSDDSDPRSISRLGHFKVPSLFSTGGGAAPQLLAKHPEQNPHNYTHSNVTLASVPTKPFLSGNAPGFVDPSETSTSKASHRESLRSTVPPPKTTATSYRSIQISPSTQGGSNKKGVVEERLLATCPYELKGQTCDVPGGCAKRKICVRYSRGEDCYPDCRDSHVLRTCKYLAKFNECKKETGEWPARCTYGHEPIRLKMYEAPWKYHDIERRH